MLLLSDDSVWAGPEVAAVCPAFAEGTAPSLPRVELAEVDAGADAAWVGEGTVAATFCVGAAGGLAVRVAGVAHATRLNIEMDSAILRGQLDRNTAPRAERDDGRVEIATLLLRSEARGSSE